MKKIPSKSPNKSSFKVKAFGLLLLILPAIFTSIAAEKTKEQELAYNQWLTDKYSNEHQELIPVVAVADMFFACNLEHKVDGNDYNIRNLVTKMDRDILAEKLSKCLGDESINSDTAINYGLHGCFHEQLAELPVTQRKQKLKLVHQAIASLSREERLKSFTQCVTDQSINYLTD